MPSPQEREIERFIPGHEVVESSVAAPRKMEVTRMIASEDGDWMRFEDHQAALQDRVAEAAHKEQIRESEVVEAQEHRTLHEDLRRKAEARANRAEAALREARDEFEKRAEGCRRLGAPPEPFVYAANYLQVALDTSMGDREPPRLEQFWPPEKDPPEACPGCGVTRREGEAPFEKAPCPGCKPPAPENFEWWRVNPPVQTGQIWINNTSRKRYELVDWKPEEGNPNWLPMAPLCLLEVGDDDPLGCSVSQLVEGWTPELSSSDQERGAGQ